MSSNNLPRPRVVKSIYQEELERATRIVEERGRTGKRLRAAHVLHCVNKMSEDEWEALSPRVKAWVTVAAQYLNRHEDPPPYPDYKEVRKRIRLRQGRAKMVRAMNTKNNRKGASYRAREIMLKYGMNISIKDHTKLLESDGFELSLGSLSSVRTHFKMSILTLYDNGYLKRKPKDFENAYKENYED